MNVNITHFITMIIWAVAEQIAELVNQGTPYRRCITSITLEGTDIFIDVIDDVLDNNPILAHSINAVGRVLGKQIMQAYKVTGKLRRNEDWYLESMAELEKAVRVLSARCEDNMYLHDVCGFNEGVGYDNQV
jgi:hypothetical protein